VGCGERTVLDEDAKRLLDEQLGIENDEAERQWKDIVTGADFEEIANRFLQEVGVSKRASQHALMRGGEEEEEEEGDKERGRRIPSLVSAPYLEDSVASAQAWGRREEEFWAAGRTKEQLSEGPRALPAAGAGRDVEDCGGDDADDAGGVGFGYSRGRDSRSWRVVVSLRREAVVVVVLKLWMDGCYPEPAWARPWYRTLHLHQRQLTARARAQVQRQMQMHRDWEQSQS
jgi:hypothetical protein